MVRYTQRVEWSPGDPNGSCQRAAWGSVLERNPDSIPKWEEMTYAQFRHSYRVWFNFLGWWVCITTDPEAPRQDAWHDCWCAFGESPRSSEEHDVSHMVVWNEGGLAWDPHPKRLGLNGDPEGYEYLRASGLPELEEGREYYSHGVCNIWT